jgi:hypothetical protein
MAQNMLPPTALSDALDVKGRRIPFQYFPVNVLTRLTSEERAAYNEELAKDEIVTW